jgi:DNA-binding MarR family transcriptional regulator
MPRIQNLQETSRLILEGDSLGKSLGFQLKMLQIETDMLAREALAPFGISPARVAALMFIKANPGCTQTALGDAFSVNRASAMKVVNFLEGRGLVRRDQGADTRANALHLTRSGTIMLRKMTEALERADARALVALSDEEIRHLFDLICRMRVSLDAPAAV